MIGGVAPNGFIAPETVQADSQIVSEISDKVAIVSRTFQLDKMQFVSVAHAEDAKSIAKDTYNRMVSVIVVMIEFLSALLWPILLLIGSLLKNDILFSGGMEQTMLSIWVNVRNLVNILFIMVLLGIAFYNVLGGSAEDYQMKSVLPKFIIALIAVNFSFLGVRLVADTVNVFTIAIFALPNTVGTELSALKTEGAPNAICSDWNKRSSFLDKNPVTSSGGTPTPTTPDATAKSSPGLINFENMCKKNANGSFDFTPNGKKFFDTFSANNAALVMAIDMGKIINIDEVRLNTTSQDPLKDLTINILLTAALYVVYTSGFLALFVILVVRMVLLWVTAVLSPIVVLRYVLPESLKSAIGGGDDLTKKLIQSLIAPVPIALMMTIGYIMFQSLKAVTFGDSPLGTSAEDFNLLTSGLSTLQDLIIAVGMVAVIWMGVFAAASGTFAEGAVNGIKGAVEGAGKFIATAPFKYLPIIPMRQADGKEGGVSAGVALGALQQLPQQLESDMYDKQRKLANRFMGKGDTEDLKFDGAKDYKGIANAFMKAGSPVDAGAQKKLHDHIKNNGKLQLELAKQMGFGKPEELMEALKNGEANKNGQLMTYIKREATDTPKVDPPAYTNLNKSSTDPMDKAIYGAFDSATQSKIDDKKTTKDEDKKQIDVAVTNLRSKWDTGVRTDVTQLDTLVSTDNQNEIARTLQDGGVAANQSTGKAKEFIRKILEAKLSKETDPTKKTQIQTAIATLNGTPPPGGAVGGGSGSAGAGGGTGGAGAAPGSAGASAP